MRATLIHRARVCLSSQLLHLRGELVAHALQLPEIQQRRTLLRTGGDDLGDVGEPVRDDPLQLALQPRDLRPQRLARRPLRLGRAGDPAIERPGVDRPAAARRPVA